jgi:5'-nucleotidase
LRRSNIRATGKLKEENRMTKENRPLIILTNDDGIEAEGLTRLTETLRTLGDIVVFAPDGPRSGMSRAITTANPIKCTCIKQENGLQIYTCTGTPTDCVKLAIDRILSPAKPRLLVSGINHGGNHALSVHYSGTLGAAFEGCVFGVPSFAVSLNDFRPGADFTESCRLARLLACRILEHGLPHGVYLNLNVPCISRVKGIAAGRQTDGRWVREYRVEPDEKGGTAYRLTGHYEPSGPDYPDNDLTLLRNGYASLVPCKVDVTDYAFLPELKNRILQPPTLP